MLDSELKVALHKDNDSNWNEVFIGTEEVPNKATCITNCILYQLEREIHLEFYNPSNKDTYSEVNLDASVEKETFIKVVKEKLDEVDIVVTATISALLEQYYTLVASELVDKRLFFSMDYEVYREEEDVALSVRGTNKCIFFNPAVGICVKAKAEDEEPTVLVEVKDVYISKGVNTKLIKDAIKKHFSLESDEHFNCMWFDEFINSILLI